MQIRKVELIGTGKTSQRYVDIIVRKPTQEHSTETIHTRLVIRFYPQHGIRIPDFIRNTYDHAEIASVTSEIIEYLEDRNDISPSDDGFEEYNNLLVSLLV